MAVARSRILCRHGRDSAASRSAESAAVYRPGAELRFYSPAGTEPRRRDRADPRQQWHLRKNHHRMDILAMDFLSRGRRLSKPRPESKLRMMGGLTILDSSPRSTNVFSPPGAQNRRKTGADFRPHSRDSDPPQLPRLAARSLRRAGLARRDRRNNCPGGLLSA